MKTILQALFLVVCSCLTSTVCHAQIPNGSVAPLWTLTDLDGTTHDLQNILDQGKTVVIDFSATWCGPCWSYHNTHALSNLHNQYGPAGTDELFVIYIESDPSTNTACLYNTSACNASSQGNWVDGTPYPIVDVATSAVPDAYGINAYPTIVTVCPDGLLYESGRATAAGHYAWKQSCDFDASLVSTTGMQCYEEQSGTADIDVTAGFGVVSYNWSNGQTTQDLANAFPGNYTCIATEGHGVKRTLNVTVPGPTSELSPNLDNASDVSCHNAGDGIIEITTSGGTPNYSFLWSNGSATEDLNNLGQGTYTLLVTDDNACTKEVVVDIIDPDAVEATVEATVENCGGQDASITIVGEGGTGSLTYTYGPETNQTGIFTNVEAGNYTAKVTDMNDCEFSEPLTVDEIPNPDLEIFPTEELTCDLTFITLSAAASVGSEFSYIWTTTDGNIITGANSLTPVVDAPGEYKIVVVNQTNGCFSQASVFVEGSSDLPAVEIAPADKFSCTTSEVTIDASNSSSGSEYTYAWTTTDGTIVSGETTDMLVVSASGTYELVITNTVSGCFSTSSVTVEGDSDVPTAAVASPSAIDCEHLSITLDGSGSSQGQDYEYEWTTTDGVIISAVDDEAVVGAAGTYTLIVLNTTTGCSSQHIVVVDDESIEVNALYGYGSTGLEVRIDDQSTGNPSSMTWDMGNGDVVTGELDLYRYALPGTYQVCLVAGNGCGDDRYCSTIIVTDRVREVRDVNPDIGIGGTEFRTFEGSNSALINTVDVTVYPNPTNGTFAVNLTEKAQISSYQMVDLDGRVMITQQLNAETSTIELDASHIANGTYFIQIQLENEVVVKPVVIMK